MRKVRHHRSSNLLKLVTIGAGWWYGTPCFCLDPQPLLYKGTDLLVIFHSSVRWWMLLCFTCIWRGQLGVAERAQAQGLRDLGSGLAWASVSHLWNVGILLANLEDPFLHQESILLWFPSLGKKLPIINTTAQDANSFANASANDRARILIQVRLTPKTSPLLPKFGKERT